MRHSDMLHRVMATGGCIGAPNGKPTEAELKIEQTCRGRN